MPYRTIDARFWTDPKVRKLEPSEKLLFLYLVTSPHSHVSGLYYVPRAAIIEETGLSESKLRYGIDTLCASCLVMFDKEIHFFWVKNMLRYQGRGKRNDQAAANKLYECHNSFLVKEFMKYYPRVAALVGISKKIGYPNFAQIPTPDQEQKGVDVDDVIIPSTAPELWGPEGLPPGKAPLAPQPEQRSACAGPKPAQVLDQDQSEFELFVQRWNFIQVVTPCRARTKKRVAAYRERRKDPWWQENRDDALARLQASHFCTGGGERGWRADVDWFLRPDTVAHLIEGKYDDRHVNGHADKLTEEIMAASAEFLGRGR